MPVAVAAASVLKDRRESQRFRGSAVGTSGSRSVGSQGPTRIATSGQLWWCQVEPAASVLKDRRESQPSRGTRRGPGPAGSVGSQGPTRIATPPSTTTSTSRSQRRFSRTDENRNNLGGPMRASMMAQRRFSRTDENRNTVLPTPPFWLATAASVLKDRRESQPLPPGGAARWARAASVLKDRRESQQPRWLGNVREGTAASVLKDRRESQPARRPPPRPGLRQRRSSRTDENRNIASVQERIDALDGSVGLRGPTRIATISTRSLRMLWRQRRSSRTDENRNDRWRAERTGPRGQRRSSRTDENRNGLAGRPIPICGWQRRSSGTGENRNTAYVRLESLEKFESLLRAVPHHQNMLG